MLHVWNIYLHFGSKMHGKCTVNRHVGYTSIHFPKKREVFLLQKFFFREGEAEILDLFFGVFFNKYSTQIFCENSTVVVPRAILHICWFMNKHFLKEGFIIIQNYSPFFAMVDFQGI